MPALPCDEFSYSAFPTSLQGALFRAKLNNNGSVREFEAEPDTPLLWVICEHLGLTGIK